MNTNANRLCDLWNSLLLNHNIEIYSKELKGISITEMKLLKLCYSHSEYKIKDYLQCLAIPNSTLSNMINRLVKKELIERTITSGDLRSYGLQLTDFGRKAIANHLAQESQLFEEMLTRLSPQEQEQFITLFAKLTEHK